MYYAVHVLQKNSSLIVLVFLLILTTCYMILSTASVTEAITMKNSDYIIQMGNLNTGSGKGSNGQYGLTVTLGQTAPGLFSGANYTLRSGFQYIYSIIPFTFRISPLEIDFGSLTPTNFVTRTQLITVSNGSAYGYVVTAAENHPLSVPESGAAIPNTACDSGTCNASTASVWTNTFAFGLGYRCEYENRTPSTCASDFSTSNSFRPFADKSSGQTPQVVTSASNITRTTTETLTYKINVSASQAPGDYSNVLEFIATPTF